MWTKHKLNGSNTFWLVQFNVPEGREPKAWFSSLFGKNQPWTEPNRTSATLVAILRREGDEEILFAKLEGKRTTQGKVLTFQVNRFQKRPRQSDTFVDFALQLAARNFECDQQSEKKIPEITSVSDKIWRDFLDSPLMVSPRI